MTLRTVINDVNHGTHITLQGLCIVPECITRFSAGTRIEIRNDPVHGGLFLVQACMHDQLRIFGEETWKSVTVQVT